MEEKKYAYKYPHPSVTADCIIFGFDGGKLKVLLIERGQDPYKGKWAFPGGFVQMDESCEDGALRELEEETGYTGGRWEEIMTIAPNPGMMDNLCHCFHACGVKKTGSQHLDETEDIEVFLRSKEEVKRMLVQGDFIQALMAAPLWKYFSSVADTTRKGGI